MYLEQHSDQPITYETVHAITISTPIQHLNTSLIQKDIDEILDTVKEAAAEKDPPENIQEVARSASERLANQEKLVRDVEKKLADKQKTDASLTEPVKVCFVCTSSMITDSCTYFTKLPLSLPHIII